MFGSNKFWKLQVARLRISISLVIVYDKQKGEAQANFTLNVLQNFIRKDSIV